MNEVVLALKDANIYQGDSLILSDVNISVNKSEFVYLVGKTGTGKSSLLKTLYGELPLVDGYGIVAGFDLSEVTWKTVPYLRRNIGIVFQDFQLLTDRSVHDNLEFVLKATGWTSKSEIEGKINEVLGKVGLSTKGFKFPYELSGGEQQRVDIARALLNSPKILLADEPTGNLDPETTEEIMNLLIQIGQELGTAIVMATHDYIVLKKYPARMIKTEGGKVIDNASITFQ